MAFFGQIWSGFVTSFSLLGLRKLYSTIHDMCGAKRSLLINALFICFWYVIVVDSTHSWAKIFIDIFLVIFQWDFERRPRIYNYHYELYFQQSCRFKTMQQHWVSSMKGERKWDFGSAGQICKVSLILIFWIFKLQACQKMNSLNWNLFKEISQY